MFVWVMIGFMVYAMFLTFQGVESRQVAYSEFKSMVKKGEVASVTFTDRTIEAELAPAASGPLGETSVHVSSHLPPVDDPELLDMLEEHGVEVRARESGGGALGWIAGLVPWLLIFGVWYLLWRRMSGGLGGLGGGFGRDGLGDFLKGRAKKVEQTETPSTRFDDIAGQDNAKREVTELLTFLRDPERYRRLGAEMPHGILLEGPPGTGKTMLARALAGEAGVPFYSTSASEFIEVFVGVGASRVRKLFEEAKKNAPAIIFMDELDSVGRVRGAGLGGGHDEREQTLNQILAEMDGFEGHEAVVVMAATNRPDVLDPALLRPGRFDRHITLELPDVDAREAILRVHTRKVPLDADVDLQSVARATPGFSGADLRNLVNEAAMAAAREGCERVANRHFEEMRDRIIMGTVRTMAIHEEEKHRLAVHESGHTALAYYLPNTDPLHKVTIIPRGRALGGTHQLPEIERHTLSEEYLHDRLAVILGGRAAEKVFLGSLSSGADEDIRMATQLARGMVGRWGMSEEVGPVDVRESEDHPFLGREIAQPRRFSEATAAAADHAVKRYLVEAEERAVATLEGHRRQIEQLVDALEKRETLDRNEIAVCLGPKEVGGRSRRSETPGSQQDARRRDTED
ncbi:cell division protein FtsH [Minwuia thermotolerans]|uniref:ATP-dependent zinc metalloprotease FtsH n=2 Tax=Minwuia thermotolerans TaxID=2056226 RepID=A0A2M9FVY1_9PROT|nr:cell division protein FtsH [Minwuia thermotolerans]